MNRARRWTWSRVRELLRTAWDFALFNGEVLGWMILVLLLLWACAGCAMGTTAGGQPMIGVPIPGTPQEAGRAAGQVLGALGVPGGPAWGELIGYALGAVGLVGGAYGVHKKGESSGWDQHAEETTPPVQTRSPA